MTLAEMLDSLGMMEVPWSAYTRAEIEVRSGADSLEIVGVGWQNGKVVLGVSRPKGAVEGT